MQYNPEELNNLLNIYKVESEEIIQELNDGFLLLEKNPKDKTPLQKLLQLVHSLKGSSRMIGFKNIQSLSHKLEDVLAYWGKNNVEIIPDSFHIIYKLCDYFCEIIEKSVVQKSEYSDENIPVFLSQLADLIKEDVPNEYNMPNNSDVLPEDYLLTKHEDVEALILELMFVIGKDDIKENEEEIILVSIENLKQLAEIFHKTDCKDIKCTLSLLLADLIAYKTKKPDFSALKQNFLDLKTHIYNIYRQHNIKTTDENMINQTVVTDNSKEIKEETNINKELIEKFDYILDNLEKTKREYNSINVINENLKSIIHVVDNRNIFVLLDKIINILEKHNNNKILVDNNSYTAIFQSVYIAKKILLNEQDVNTNNYDLFIQRLNLISDMLNISSSNTAALENIRKNDILKLGQISNSKPDLSAYDLQEIKTLRVDTTKLDSLISQTGELLINGIKTREHIKILSDINDKLSKWHSVGKKITAYLKYIEKKGVFENETSENFNAFYKKTMGFFTSNDALIDEINSDFISLYNMISEDDNKLYQTAAEIENIAKEIRVLPLATIFHSFPRMIRDIAKENNKKIDFIISGSDTTVDKKIIEEVKIPLIHILRNSVSHGIELPEERVKNGKNETGVINLSAKQVENTVIITIEDDGYGVNIEKVKEIALRKELLTEEEINLMSNEQLMKLLFLPGFSTEDSVNEISGRGVGLDIVKTKITNLNGEIMIDSVLNEGCKVTIKFPLSLSTIKAFILLVNEQKYVIPVSCIKYVKTINSQEILNRNGMNYIVFEEHSVPLYYLSEIMGEEVCKNNSMTVMILENQSQQAAFIVDAILGDQDVFQKKLMLPIMKIRNISGLTTLSTGEICLILNPVELMKSVNFNLSITSEANLNQLTSGDEH